MTEIENTRAFRKGSEGERTVEAWLRSRGWFVMRLANIKSEDGVKAPMLLGADATRIRLPDLGAMRSGHDSLYVEVKWKSQPGWSSNMQCRTHGFGRRKFFAYREFARVSGANLWVLIFEDLTGFLIGMCMNSAPEPDQVDVTDNQEPGGVVYWRRDRFIGIAQLERRQYVLDGLGETLPGRGDGHG